MAPTMNASKDQQTKTEVALQQQKQKHMQLLHEYNNLKDATQTVLGALAQAKGVPIRDMHKMYNLPDGK
ncbi:PREDICTED: DNA repair protein SWI5 homolog [Drosophila arizonae]|uniref:DNA repair protein SWI5 homolog n=1 Tax=Drosophila arizonae TaxID=7263 RepID=A0ABM1P1K2_DROAR|nr:PREDICTED: DNA repair protein SWI5 homolog [Drosophila arizonae]